MPVGWWMKKSDASTYTARITPANASNNIDGISMQEFRLKVDATANRAQMVSELKNKLTNGQYSGFADQLAYGGKTTTYYKQILSNAIIDWYVIWDQHVQVSVGCTYTTDSPGNVTNACANVVTSLTITQPAN
jgi:type VII secretion-associated protein (TIGR03931 family)